VVSGQVLLLVCSAAEAPELARQLGFGCPAATPAQSQTSSAGAGAGAGDAGAGADIISSISEVISGSDSAWADLVARLIQVSRASAGGAVSNCDSSSSSDEWPVVVYTGTQSRGAWAVPLGIELGKLVPSGEQISLAVGVRLVTRTELTSCGSPFQHVIPAGTRGRVHTIKGDFFTVDMPAAVYCCGNGCVMFDFPDLPAMEALVQDPLSERPGSDTVRLLEA